MNLEHAVVLWNKKISSSCYNIGLKCHKDFFNAIPGQFIMLDLPGKSPFLRRPFSIHKLIIEKDSIIGIELLYRVVGEGTRILANMQKGDIASILGPLGNGFLIKNKFQRIFIVAGGIGVAPILFLSLFLQKKGFSLSKVSIFMGAKNKDDLLCIDDFVNIGMNILIATDDGSYGKKGLITDLLTVAVKENKADIIFTCGPSPMLKQVAKIAKMHKIPCQISVESVMACGLGACLGCAIKGRGELNKYMHVCADGPVFNSKTLDL